MKFMKVLLWRLFFITWLRGDWIEPASWWFWHDSM